ncbi:MAG: hypothetical protein HZA54_13495 [Planctomycetes bacterium]|nr:hypothetical protein [Planctomycetota bacterium]
MAGFRVGLAALAFSLFSKALVFHEIMPLKESVAVACEDAALCALLLAAGRARFLAAGGFALGLGALARGNLRLLLPIAACCARSWKGAACVLAGGLLAFAPAMLRNALVDEFAVSTAQFGQNLYIGNNPENTTGRYVRPSFVPVSLVEQEEAGFRREAERRLGRTLSRAEIDAYWRDEALRYIADHPLTFARTVAKRFLLLVNRRELEDEYDVHYFEEFTPVFAWLLPAGLLFPLAGVGLGLSWKRYPVLTALLAAYAASLLPFFIFARYRLPVLPCVCLFAALGLAELGALVRPGAGARRRGGAAALLAGSILLVNAPIERLLDVGFFETSNSHGNLGLLLLQQGNPREALRELERAFAIQPRMTTRGKVVHGAAIACLQLGEVLRAETYLKRAIEVAPQDHRPCLDLGLLYLKAGEPARAVACYRLAAARAPHETAPRQRLAQACVANEQPEEALQVWTEAGVAFPQSILFRLERMRLLERLGRALAAQAAALEVLELDPGNAEAVAAAERLRSQ